jgi:hypothetical protein
VSASVVVVVEIVHEGVCAVLVCGVGVGADPAVEECLDEAFGFAVCLWAADAGVARGDAALFPGALEAFAVVGEDLFDLDAVAAVEAAAAVEEVEGVGGCFGGVAGGVCEPCSVVDADEQVVPAGFAFGAVGQACVGVAGPLDAAEPFDVDVDQLAGPLPFVADHRLTHGWVEAGDAVAAEDRVHRRDRYAELPADRVRPRPELPAGLEDRPLKRRRGAPG